MTRTLSRFLRTLLQLVAAGGLTAVVAAVADLAPNAKPVVLAISALAVTLAQNLLESSGKVPTILEDAHARKAPPA